MNMNPENTHNSHKTLWLSRQGIAAILFVGIVIFFLLTGHAAHVLGALPWLLLLSCPLMHFFMHGKHHHHDEHSEKNKDNEPPHH